MNKAWLLNGNKAIEPIFGDDSTLISDKLSGEKGSNRAQGVTCQIRAKNDYEAMKCWLDEYKDKQTTYRTYQREAERFMLWAIINKEKALSSLTREDIEDYIQFIDDPQPREFWCGKHKGMAYRRGDPKWRPFTGGLSASAKSTAISIINSLLTYLTEARYLEFNPLSLMRKKYAKIHKPQHQHLMVQERILSSEEWTAMLDTLNAYPESTKEEAQDKHRTIFIINILYFLGLRVSELTSHTWNTFRKMDGKWWFYVVGKGSKLARIPVNDELLKAVIKYRGFLNKSLYPDSNEAEPIITSHKGSRKSIEPRQVNKILKKLALQTAEKFSESSESRNKLKKFSAHWIRHLSASMQDKLGVSFKHIRENMRHEKDETTRQYIHLDEDIRHREMQKLTIELQN